VNADDLVSRMRPLHFPLALDHRRMRPVQQPSTRCGGALVIVVAPFSTIRRATEDLIIPIG